MLSAHIGVLLYPAASAFFCAEITSVPFLSLMYHPAVTYVRPFLYVDVWGQGVPVRVSSRRLGREIVVVKLCQKKNSPVTLTHTKKNAVSQRLVHPVGGASA